MRGRLTVEQGRRRSMAAWGGSRSTRCGALRWPAATIRSRRKRSRNKPGLDDPGFPAVGCGNSHTTPAGRDATAAAGHGSSRPELIIGTKLAPPRQDRDGGPASASSCGATSVRLKLKYRFVEEPTVQGLIEKTAAKTYDASIAAITVTANRESVLDFSQPYYVTGLGIAVARGGPPMWSQIGWTLISFSFLQAVLALLGIAIVVALLIWFFYAPQ